FFEALQTSQNSNDISNPRLNSGDCTRSGIISFGSISPPRGKRQIIRENRSSRGSYNEVGQLLGPATPSSCSRPDSRLLQRAPGHLEHLLTGHALRPCSSRPPAGGGYTPRPLHESALGSSSGPASSSSLTSSASSPSLRLRLRPEAEVRARLGWNAESGGRSSQWAAALPSGWEAGPARVLGSEVLLWRRPRGRAGGLREEEGGVGRAASSAGHRAFALFSPECPLHPPHTPHTLFAREPGELAA
ncbi:hypothetical protein HispidOSU_014474, partial [Sigmodon hispidus]